MATKRRASLPFVGVDGEGADINGSHEYLLLRAGSDVLLTGDPLGWQECFPFLSSLPPRYEYVSYFFNYDTTMMCRWLPDDVLAVLLDREARELPEGRGHTPVSYAGYQFDWVPSKEFKVRRHPLKGDRVPWTVISDVGSFFQCSFVKALRQWGIGTDEQLAMIERGKARRGEFVTMGAEEILYNEMEIDLLESLMEVFRHVCSDIGYLPRRWQGPGNLAASMFKSHGVPTHDEFDIPAGVWRYAQAGYYGGRFEATGYGWIR